MTSRRAWYLPRDPEVPILLYSTEVVSHNIVVGVRCAGNGFVAEHLARAIHFPPQPHTRIMTDVRAIHPPSARTHTASYQLDLNRT